MKRVMFAAIAVVGLAGCCLFKCDCPAYTALSPDGKNEIRLWTKPLAYEVVRDDVVVVSKTEIGMKVDGECLCKNAKSPVATEKSLSGCVKTPTYKKSKVCLKGNETFVDFGDWGVRLAARNDGVAYRFETKKNGKIKVNCEKATFKIPCAKAKCSLNYGIASGCEETIPLSCEAGEIATGLPKQKHVYLPFVYSIGGKTVAVTESDLWDYPVLNFVRKESADGVAFDSKFSNCPSKTAHASNGANWKAQDVATGGRWVRVKESADYLVETEGTRTFPWRTFILADSPSKLCESDIVFALSAAACPKCDFSWIKPGKVAWDWWNSWDNLGEKAGCTTKGYERFIDFAAKTGVEYVIFDEGWSETLNIWKFHPNVDVPYLIDYANKKGVGIILWMAWAQVYGDEERVAEHFAKLGAKGFKVDFMDRGDADVERFLAKFAKACAKNKMLVDYHGAHRPTGMHRKYPNVINYEGIHGLECTKWFHNEYDFMDNDVKAFFLRLTAGPMDYTPGAMDNYPVGQYKGNNKNPGSVGTRCRQIAMMSLYEAPLQMLCDAPTKYEANMECFKFMAATPVVWDDTVGLGGCPDSYAAVARRKGDVWYASGITNKDGREIEVDTAFLGNGDWKAEIFRDADDADKVPTKFVHEQGKSVKAGDKIKVRMAPGGGFAIRFTK